MAKEVSELTDQELETKLVSVYTMVHVIGWFSDSDLVLLGALEKEVKRRGTQGYVQNPETGKSIGDDRAGQTTASKDLLRE